MTTFPSAVASKPLNITANQTILADHVSLLWDEVIAAESALLGGTTLNMRVRRDNTGDQAIGVRRVLDTNERLAVTAGGAMTWGSGTATGDVTLARDGVRTLALSGNVGITSQASGDVPLQVTGAASQTTLVALKDSTGTTVTAVSGAGALSCASAVVAGSLSAGTTTLGTTGTGALTATTLGAGNTTITGTLGVSGTTTLAAVGATNATLSGTLGVTGTTTVGVLNAGTTTASALTVTTTSALAAASATSAAVSGNATVGGTLGVTGLATLSGGASATTGSFSGNVTVGGTLGVTGATTMTALTATGQSTLGAAATADFAVVTISQDGLRTTIGAGRHALAVQRSTDTQARLEIVDDNTAGGSVTLRFSPGNGAGGSDVNLYRDAPARLRTSGAFRADGLITRTKAGVAVDGDFATAPPDGALAVDTDNQQLCLRANGAWHGTRTEYTQAFLMMGA